MSMVDWIFFYDQLLKMKHNEIDNIVQKVKTVAFIYSHPHECNHALLSIVPKLIIDIYPLIVVMHDEVLRNPKINIAKRAQWLIWVSPSAIINTPIK